MTLQECSIMIQKEGLPHAVIGDQKPYCHDLCLKKQEETWVVYATDERASIVTGSEAFFDTEEAACENFMKRLRAGAKLAE